MSNGNETIVLNIENMFIFVSGSRMTALPAAGTIASLEKGSPDATVVAAMFRTSSLVFNPADVYTATLNIMPGSADDQFLQQARSVSRATGRPLSFEAVYGTSSWSSSGCVILGDPVRNFIADNTEVQAYQLSGVFETNVFKFANVEALNAEEISAG